VSSLPAVHLCIVQPVGYVHSLGFVDQARHFRYHFRRMGAEVSIAKNRLRHDAINFVFGAHLGFDAALRKRYTCVFVNLEQLGAGGAKVPDDYMALLRGSAVADYDAANVPAYAEQAGDVCVLPMLHSPYLAPAKPLPLHERPIDLLFFGSMNERRQRIISAIEAQGVNVAMFDSPLYGAERDHYIGQARAVLNCHFYESSRFEQARVSHCLSLGTPVICERTARTEPHPAFEEAVFWFDERGFGDFFQTTFNTPAWFAQSQAMLDDFAKSDGIEAYADLLAFACGYRQEHAKGIATQPWRPTRINLGSGKDYKSGWLNVDISAAAEPDLLLDLSGELALPLRASSANCGALELEAGSVETIYANNVLEHVANLPRLLTNCLNLLQTGGRFEIEVPYEHNHTAWQDPTHVRAMNEQSWLYVTDWFWYLGWFEHRFAIEASSYLDINLKECGREQAAFMRMLLQKVETTPQERTAARALQSDLRLPDDTVPAHQVYGATQAAPARSLAAAVAELAA
jgi:SAM-dependent methyltransferase